MDQQKKYRDSCTHFRKGAVVKMTADPQKIVFNGGEKLSKTQKERGMRGVNAAKRFVRQEGLRSYTVR